MRSCKRLALAVVVATGLGNSGVLPALADDEGGAGGTSTAFLNETGDPTAVAREVVDRPGTPSGSVASECEWVVVNADDTEFGMYDVDGNRLHSDTGRWFERRCAGSPVPVNGSYAVPERRQVDPAALAREAVESVQVPSPAIATSPAADDGLYTRVRTWLWIEEAWWRGYEATAEAGGVSSTVTAAPVRTTWSMGDGSSVVCAGPGVEWRPGMQDSATDCSYVYKHSSAGSPDGTYTLTVTVEFAVSWSSNVAPGGTLPGITRSVSRSVEVDEIQAVETD